jgi:hypothetical protein
MRLWERFEALAPVKPGPLPCVLNPLARALRQLPTVGPQEPEVVA